MPRLGSRTRPLRAHLPLADNTVDVILSNCVINLSPDKGAVFHDAFRVLKPGGRLAISDVVKTQKLSSDLENDVAAFTGCVSGAAGVEMIRALLRVAGFEEIRVEVKEASRELIRDWLPGSGVENYVASANHRGHQAGLRQVVLRTVVLRTGDLRMIEPAALGAWRDLEASCARSSRAACAPRSTSTTSCRTSSCGCSAASSDCATTRRAASALILRVDSTP